MKTLMMMLALMMICGVAVAADTDNPNWKYFGETGGLKHTHRYSGYEAPWGVGIDLDLYDNDYVTVAAEGRYDFNNKVNSTYAVVKPKIVVWDMVAGLFR